MAGRSLEVALRYFKRQLTAPATGEWTDRQLLERFTSQRDQEAFASLVRRHGPLVLGVGRRVLHHDQDAEDVFQATFLILARKANSGGWQNSLAGWLYCVAYRLATRTRTRIIRQRALQHEAGIVSAMRAPTIENRPELYRVLDEELHRLSERCRQPLLLCYLEGKTRDEAARQLGWSLRTLQRRLEQGLKLLRVRLSRRGLELPMALLAAGLSQQAASANVSAASVQAAVETAVAYGSGAAPAGGAISTTALTLAEGGLKAMAMMKLRTGAVVLLAAAVAAAGVGWVGYRLLATEQSAEHRTVAERTASTPAAVVWPEGATVTGRVVDHRGARVANAEVLLLGTERIIVDAARWTWFVSRAAKDRSDPPSTRTNMDGEFSIERKKGTADRLAVIAEDPLLWLVSRKSLAQGNPVEIKLPPAGSLVIRCKLPGKAAKQPVNVELRSLDGIDWDTDVLRFHFGSFSVTNPGETAFEHLPPGQYAVQRFQETQTDKDTVLMTGADRQLAKVEPNKRTTIRFERGAGRPLIGKVRGLVVATKDTTSAKDGFTLTDLAPGSYRVSVNTYPKHKSLSGSEINPGAFHDIKELALEPGQSEAVRFHYQALDANAFRGQRTAVLRIRMPDGTPARNRKVKVGYYDGHYGSLSVFSGSVPDSGELRLENITDRVTHSSPGRSYTVTVDNELLGLFGFTTGQPTQEFDFQLAPRAGDLAPDVQLRRIAGGAPTRLSSLRGKVVCLEFWATWCGPCQPAMAKLNHLTGEQGAGWKDRVALLPISIDASPERVKSHVARRGWDRLEHYWAGTGADTGSDFDAPAARAFVVSGVPETILIGPDGRFLWRGHPLDNTGGQNLRSRIETELKK